MDIHDEIIGYLDENGDGKTTVICLQDVAEALYGVLQEQPKHTPAPLGSWDTTYRITQE